MLRVLRPLHMTLEALPCLHTGSRSVYLGSHLCTHGGATGGSTLLASPPYFAHLLFAKRRAMFSLHTSGRNPQKRAIREAGGGRGGGLRISACRRSLDSLIASFVHCWRNASLARASSTFLRLSSSFLHRSASHRSRF